MEPIISFRKAHIAGGDNVVVYDLDMDIHRGDLVYITGKVGTGKTSIIRTITAENRIVKGHGEAFGFRLESIRGKDIPRLRRKLGVIFQDFQLLMDRPVRENLDFVLRSTGWKNAGERDARIARVLEAVGMTTKAHKMPHQLSGGEQQRVAIARALLNEPELILADEPTGNLDDETAAGILDLLNTLNKEKGTAIVMVTHDQGIVERYPGRVFTCIDETCIETGAKPATDDAAATI